MIAAMKEDGRSRNIRTALVATVYGDDQDDKSYSEMRLWPKASQSQGVISPTRSAFAPRQGIMDDGSFSARSSSRPRPAV